MSLIDWLILIFFFTYTIWDGVRQNKKEYSIESLLLARRNMPWWAIGFSVMATQASAITFIGTTGLAYIEDMKFLQVYLGIPIAMVILCVTLLPFYFKQKTFTAYETLEKQFGLKVRLSVSMLFLISRGLVLGAGIAAPAYILALIINMPLYLTIIVMGATATVYTMFGGITAVIRTDIKQMLLTIVGLLFCFFWIIWELPKDVSFQDSLVLSGSLGKLKTIDLSFDFNNKYTIWSGIIAGMFLMLSYFGCDQTQVQRYLTARSLKDARGSILMSAIAKIPMQFLILLMGAILYIFYIFHQPPIVFKKDIVSITIQEQQSFNKLHQKRKTLAYKYLKNQDINNKNQLIAVDSLIFNIRKDKLTAQNPDHHYKDNDTNYILPYFILNEIPKGVIGLIIAAIFASALSSIDSSLNSLTTVFIIDWYKRLHKHKKPAHHYLNASRFSTVIWGVIATFSALAFGETEAIVELINRFGSYFYGSLLGVFILLWIKRNAKTNKSETAILIALFSGMTSVFFIDLCSDISYLWFNPIGAFIVVIVAHIFGLVKYCSQYVKTNDI